MEQALPRTGRHSGWSEEENRLLWETADEAQSRGLPLKQVFDRIAEQTGRRPNSIRNYYYAQARQRSGMRPAARFVPFTEEEVASLVEEVLRARAQGRSVRSCLQRMSGGDHSLMLRYQNKYRSVLKNRPELIQETVERLRGEGVSCPMPQLTPRPRATLDQACASLREAARSTSEPELIRACDVLARLMLSGVPRGSAQLDRMNVRLDLYRLALDERGRTIGGLCEAADGLAGCVKEYLVKSEAERAQGLDAFCEALKERLGPLESRVTEASAAGMPLAEA